MVHRSKLEVWLFAAIFYIVAVLAVDGDYWIGAPVLLILLILSFPHTYVLARDGLRVRAGLARWVIPYQGIALVESSGGHVAIRFPDRRQMVLAPSDPEAFCADVALHAPHLRRDRDFPHSQPPR